MRKTKRFRWLRYALIVIMVCGLAILPQTVLSQERQIFTVNSILDEPDGNIGDGNCISNPSRLCTLRAAVQEGQAVNRAVTVPAGLYELSQGHRYHQKLNPDWCGFWENKTGWHVEKSRV